MFRAGEIIKVFLFKIFEPNFALKVIFKEKMDRHQNKNTNLNSYRNAFSPGISWQNSISFCFNSSMNFIRADSWIFQSSL